MLNSLIFAITALTVIVAVSSLWLAIWAYRKLSITVFIWLAVINLTRTASGLLFEGPSRYKSDQAVKHLQELAEHANVSLGQMVGASIYLGQLFPLLVTLFLGLIAASEITHLDSSFAQHRFFAQTY
jgi:hypothetical protein